MAFDVKQAGLEVAEDTAKSVIAKIVMPFAQDYIEKSPTKIDDILLPFLGELEKHMLIAADKIDGKEG